MNPYSTHSYPEFLVTAGDFSSSYGYFFFDKGTHSLPLLSGSGTQEKQGALRGVEKEKMLSQKIDFKLLWF